LANLLHKVARRIGKGTDKLAQLFEVVRAAVRLTVN
jgi:hypothetical protein